MINTVRMMTLFCFLVMTMSALPALGCPDCGCEVQVKEAPTQAIATASSNESNHDAVEHRSSHKDRQAILAMAGEYRVTFQFQETVAAKSDYKLKEPYRSEATEFVEVIEDSGDFISLQHVLVIHREGKDPVVVKHWRQDWKFEDTQLLVFRGNQTWEQTTLTADEAKGTWSQAVYQVDDSPRYESIGQWTHVGERSAWESEETWRPLPRREFSKRSDYQVLVAKNRHTITPAGWVHEQDNYKLILDENNQPKNVIAHETGLNVYDRVDDVDFAAGQLYWEQTSSYWEDVREVWDDVFAQNPRLTLAKEVDGERLHNKLMAMAQSNDNLPESDQSDSIRKIINAYVKTAK